LATLKERGYRIVSRAATPDRPATRPSRSNGTASADREVAISRWPKNPNFMFTATRTLPAPVFAQTWIGAMPDILDHAQARPDRYGRSYAVAAAAS